MRSKEFLKDTKQQKRRQTKLICYERGIRKKGSVGACADREQEQTVDTS